MLDSQALGLASSEPADGTSASLSSIKSPVLLAGDAELLLNVASMDALRTPLGGNALVGVTSRPRPRCWAFGGDALLTAVLTASGLGRSGCHGNGPFRGGLVVRRLLPAGPHDSRSTHNQHRQQCSLLEPALIPGRASADRLLVIRTATMPWWLVGGDSSPHTVKLTVDGVQQ